MIDIDKLDDNVLSSIIKNLGCEEGEDETPYYEQVKGMSIERAFDCYCEWEGLVGWSDSLTKAIDSIRSSLVPINLFLFIKAENYGKITSIHEESEEGILLDTLYTPGRENPQIERSFVGSKNGRVFTEDETIGYIVYLPENMLEILRFIPKDLRLEVLDKLAIMTDYCHKL